MIVQQSEVRISLGLEGTITNHERALLPGIHASAESAVREELQYDPEQKSRVEFYPQRASDLTGRTFWDVNAAHSKAILQYETSVTRDLQLKHLPVRSIAELKIDSNGRFGKGTGAFPAGTEQTEGTDYYTTYEQDDLCESGLLMSSGAWSETPGSIKITYRAGYSPIELAGQATADRTDSGVITTAFVNARPIVQAVILTVVKFFKTIEENRKQANVGFIGGAIKSEKLGDYSYTLSDGSQSSTAMVIGLSPEAIMLLEPFKHFGLMRL